MNFGHGRRVFALQQLEALVGFGPDCSTYMEYLEDKIEYLTKGRVRDGDSDDSD